MDDCCVGISLFAKNKKMKKLLIITKNFLDQQDAQAQQSLALVKLLSFAGYKIDLVVADMGDLEVDVNLDGVNIYKIPSKNLTKKQDLLSKISRKIKRNLSSVFPTDWVKGAVRKSIDILMKKDIDVVFTIGLPIESHLAGLALNKRIDDLFWIAHFSDPWPESIMPKPYSDWSIPLLDLMQRKKVQSVIESANKITFTCIEQKLFFDNFYKIKNNYEIVPHIAPEYHLPSLSLSLSDSDVVITYAGSLSRERVCKGFAEALGMLPKDSKIIVEFYGYVHADMMRYLDEFGASHRVRYKEWVNKDELFFKTTNSICYLLIDAKMGTYPFLPSKLADYATSGKSVYAITGDDSPSARIINERGSGMVSGHDSVDILNTLKRIESGDMPKGDLRSEFDPAFILSIYESIIKEANHER